MRFLNVWWKSFQIKARKRHLKHSIVVLRQHLVSLKSSLLSITLNVLSVESQGTVKWSQKTDFRVTYNQCVTEHCDKTLLSANQLKFEVCRLRSIHAQSHSGMPSSRTLDFSNLLFDTVFRTKSNSQICSKSNNCAILSPMSRTPDFSFHLRYEKSRFYCGLSFYLIELSSPRINQLQHPHVTSRKI